MVNEINYVLYNAPAGSGKTTTLKRLLRDFHYQDIKKNFLCITFTNRAAEEMQIISSTEYVISSTIHSFLNSFLCPYFKLPAIINDYITLFKKNIELKLDLSDEKNVDKLNRYREKVGCLKEGITLEDIQNNIKEISYAETPFSSYLYGKLGHDDLLVFSSYLFKKYDILNRKLTDKFDYIFIDEYQDTDDKIIELFFNAVKGTKTKLFMFGDRMQQIYGSNNTFLIEHINAFKIENLSINYRSSEEIVNCLNKIYNDKNFFQTSYKGNNNSIPKFIITNKIKETANEIKEKIPDILELYLLNNDKYLEIGVSDLYNVVSKLPDYQFGNQYTANDIITSIEDNPDFLFRVIYGICNLNKLYNENNIGLMMNYFKKYNFLNEKYIMISVHSDKEIIKRKMESLFQYFNSDISVKEFIDYLITNQIIKKNFEFQFDEERETLKNLRISSFIKIYDFLIKQMNISTQHGVKGESHKNVMFISSDSKNSPHVDTTSFYKLISLYDINFNEFDYFNQMYSNLQIELENSNNEEKNQKIKDFMELYKLSPYFISLVKNEFENYIKKPNITNLKKIRKTLVERAFSAYKLFYVGCSRAMDNLFVLVDRTKVNSFEADLANKMTKLGFAVEIVD